MKSLYFARAGTLNGSNSMTSRKFIYLSLIGAVSLSFLPSTFFSFGGFLVLDVVSALILSFLFYPSFFFRRLSSILLSRFHMIAIFLGLFIFILGFANTGDYSSSLRDFKSYVLLIVSYLFAKKMRLDLGSLFYVSFFSLLVSVVLVIYFPRDLDVSGYKNHFCLFLVTLLILASYGKPLLVRFSGISVALFACFLSGFRSSFILFGLSLLLLLFIAFMIYL
jgi:hypothetical protein